MSVELFRDRTAPIATAKSWQNAVNRTVYPISIRRIILVGFSRRTRIVFAFSFGDSYHTSLLITNSCTTPDSKSHDTWSSFSYALTLKDEYSNHL